MGTCGYEMNGYFQHARKTMNRSEWYWPRGLLFRLIAATFFLGSCGAVTIGSQVYGSDSKKTKPPATAPETTIPETGFPFGGGGPATDSPGMPGTPPGMPGTPPGMPGAPVGIGNQPPPPPSRPASNAIPGIGIGGNRNYGRPRVPRGIPGIGTGTDQGVAQPPSMPMTPPSSFPDSPFGTPPGGTSPAYDQPSIGIGATPGIGTSAPVDPGSSGGFGVLGGYRSPVFFGSERRLRVGVLLPITGRFAALGNNLLMAAKKAREDFRQVPIDLIVADSGGTPEQTRVAMHRLLEKQVRVVIGPVFSGPVREALHLSSQYDLPLITLNPNQSLLASGGNAFNHAYLNAFHQDHQARLMARFAIENGRKRVAILAPDHAAGQQIVQAFVNTFEPLGGQVVKIISFPRNSHDFSDVFKELGYKKPDEKKTSTLVFEEVKRWADFDALFIPAPAKTVRLIAPQAAFFGLMMPEVIMLGTSLWETEVLLSEGTLYLMDAVYTDIDQNGWKKFSASFERRWKVKPEKLAILSYDGVAAVAQLFQDQRSGRDSSGGSGLLRERGFKGIGSRVRFLHNGLSQREYTFIQVGAGGARPFNPSAVKYNLKYKRYWWSDSEDEK